MRLFIIRQESALLPYNGGDGNSEKVKVLVKATHLGEGGI